MKGRLAEVTLLFLKLGFIGFGGPAAHIALMREETVRRRAWLSDQEFLARKAMAGFQAKLVDLTSWLPQGSVGSDGQFTPQALAVYVSDYQADQSLREPSAWTAQARTRTSWIPTT